MQCHWLAGSGRVADNVFHIVNRYYAGIAPISQINDYAVNVQTAFSGVRAEPPDHLNRLVLNSNEERASADELTAKELEEFSAANELDRALYDAALEAWSKVA